jgi:undecaprenyldiphospho-muramoylpentapeptide beta-N-acetylglucosaminyltransferase
MGQRTATPSTFALIAGGGTAGHLLPGLAVARALVAAGHSSSSIHFVGSERGLETTVVPEAGFTLTALPGRGIQRRLTFENVSAVFGLLRAVLSAIGLIRRRRPRVVLIVGGYASASCVVAAVIWRVPIVVAEQNAVAGAVNRLAGRFAKVCAVTFPGTDLPRSIVTGNPVRAEVLAVDRQRDRESARIALGIPLDRVLIAVVAGSLGARSVNGAVREALGYWAGRGDLAIRHVIGRRDWEVMKDSPIALPPDGLLYETVEYEQRMDLVYAAADLLIGRAGGTTVAELAEVGLPGVLVPLPGAPRDHQTANAAALVGSGAAILIPNGELDGARLVDEIQPLLNDRARLQAMAESARGLAMPDAAVRVAELMERESLNG